MFNTLPNEIIDALKSKSWQTARELRSEIGDKRNRLGPHPFWKLIGIFFPGEAIALSDRSPYMEDMYINLEVLEEKGVLTRRSRENPEAVLDRTVDRNGHEWNLA